MATKVHIKKSCDAAMRWAMWRNIHRNNLNNQTIIESDCANGLWLHFDH